MSNQVRSDANLPILYSFRRCPYAIRARMAIVSAGVQVRLREVVLKSKPSELIACSSKATVPVLHIMGNGPGKEQNDVVIEESLEIMFWALVQHDPQHWLRDQLGHQCSSQHELIRLNDGEFKYYLDRYKYSDRYPERPTLEYRKEAERFLQILESHLSKSGFLVSDHCSIVDVAIFPFIRQFAHVDRDWFYQSRYRNLCVWLDYFMEHSAFSVVMAKYAAFKAGSDDILFP